MNDLLYVYDNRGSSEAYSILHALENNCPKNYHEYKFNPTKAIVFTKYAGYSLCFLFIFVLNVLTMGEK